jgi:serralysin
MGVASTTRDVVTDFRKTTANGFDLIDLSQIDANAGGGGSNDAFVFRATAGAAFTGAGQIRWFQEDRAGTANDKTIIVGNVDADLTAEFQIELRGLVTLKATDFIL